MDKERKEKTFTLEELNRKEDKFILGVIIGTVIFFGLLILGKEIL